MMHPQEFKSDLALFTLVVFILLLGLLLKFAWGPITRGLDKREQGIADQIEQARLDAEQSAETLQQYQQQLQAAVQEAQQIVAQARQDAETAGDKIIVEAKESAGRERDRALVAIDAATRAALDEVAQRGTDIAVELAGKIVSRELTAADHTELIRNSIDQFASKN
jgi:F-type H+-transporting ATPase subunit b